MRSNRLISAGSSVDTKPEQQIRTAETRNYLPRIVSVSSIFTVTLQNCSVYPSCGRIYANLELEMVCRRFTPQIDATLNATAAPSPISA